MPGTNAGTGQPIHFRCGMCRRCDAHWRRGFKDDIELTGRTKPFNNLSSGRHGFTRLGHVVYEYRCKACGHRGWSRHNDLKRLHEQARED